MIDGAVLLQADIWQAGEIVADIWYSDEDQFNLSAETKDVANYYLRQMNFLGNEITV